MDMSPASHDRDSSDRQATAPKGQRDEPFGLKTGRSPVEARSAEASESPRQERHGVRPIQDRAHPMPSIRNGPAKRDRQNQRRPPPRLPAGTRATGRAGRLRFAIETTSSPPLPRQRGRAKQHPPMRERILTRDGNRLGRAAAVARGPRAYGRQRASSPRYTRGRRRQPERQRQRARAAQAALGRQYQCVNHQAKLVASGLGRKHPQQETGAGIEQSRVEAGPLRHALVARRLKQAINRECMKIGHLLRSGATSGRAGSNSKSSRLSDATATRNQDEGSLSRDTQRSCTRSSNVRGTQA